MGPTRVGKSLVEKLNVDGQVVQVAIVSMGNPHAVQLVKDVETAPVTTQGPKLEHHKRFPDRVNAGYMQVVDRHHIKLRVWEPGAVRDAWWHPYDETLGSALRSTATILYGRPSIRWAVATGRFCAG